MVRLVAAIFGLLVLGMGANASAAISTFPASVFQTGGTGSGNLVGNTTGSARLNRGQTIGLFYGPGSSIAGVSGSRFFFNITAVSNTTTYLWVRLGNWNGTTFTNANSSGQLAPTGGATGNVYAQITGAGLVTIFSAPFSASCLAIGGCNAVVFGNSTFSAGGSFFSISSLVAATPEPSVWAMMMVGFFSIAMRLKALRRRSDNRRSVHLSAA